LESLCAAPACLGVADARQAAACVAADGHAEGESTGGVVVADLELEDVEQLSLKIFWQSGEVGVDDREFVE
jgi:hypothetical protein